MKATMIASPGYTKRCSMIWYTTSNTTARMNTFPTLFHPSLIMAARWEGSETKLQKYGGLPVLASDSPERIAKTAAITGCSTSLNFIGPLTRATRSSAIRINMLSIIPSFLVISLTVDVHAAARGPSAGGTNGTIDGQCSLTANTRKTNATSTAISVTGKKAWPLYSTAISV